MSKKMKVAKRAARTCPTHGVKLEKRGSWLTRHWVCPENGCRVTCGDGPTSTPADPALAKLRGRVHQKFDPLWQQKKFESRFAAYEWLAEQMGIGFAKCHIGMFDSKQCLKALGIIEAYSMPPGGRSPAT